MVPFVRYVEEHGIEWHAEKLKYSTAYEACWLDNQGYRHTRSVYFILLLHIENGYVNAPPCYITRTLPVLYKVLNLC
jgi:hypothetical protein